MQYAHVSVMSKSTQFTKPAERRHLQLEVIVSILTADQWETHDVLCSEPLADTSIERGNVERKWHECAVGICGTPVRGSRRLDSR